MNSFSQLREDLEEHIKNVVREERQQRFDSSDQLTLGQLIDKIRLIIYNDLANNSSKHEAIVKYNFGGMFPNNIDSWRGSYDELALNFVDFYESEDRLTAAKFIELLEASVGKTFGGYKGGEFVMSRDTPIWMANHGHDGNTAVIDVLYRSPYIIFVTGYRDY